MEVIVLACSGCIQMQICPVRDSDRPLSEWSCFGVELPVREDTRAFKKDKRKIGAPRSRKWHTHRHMLDVGENAASEHMIAYTQACIRGFRADRVDSHAKPSRKFAHTTVDPQCMQQRRTASHTSVLWMSACPETRLRRLSYPPLRCTGSSSRQLSKVLRLIYNYCLYYSYIIGVLDTIGAASVT